MKVPLFGVNAATGKRAFEPMSIEDVESLAPKNKTDDTLGEQAKRTHDKTIASDKLGLAASVKDPEDLSQTGWAIAWGENVSAEIKGKLAPLIAFRKSQMGGNAAQLFRELEVKKNDTLQSIRERWKFGPGAIDPKKVPAYVMIVAPPADFSFDLQHKLDVDLFVGRLDLDDAAAYEAYAKAVIASEKNAARPKKAVFWGPKHPNDGATALSLPNLVTPLAKYVEEKKTFDVIQALEAGATKAVLEKALGAEVPGLLFTGGHGALIPKPEDASEETLQLELQGALITQEWPNDPNSFKLADTQRFAASDLTSALDGLVAIFFACYGGGTPRKSRFPYAAMEGIRDLAPIDFTARLPRAMLARGAAAVIAHVERTWDTGFSWDGIGEPQLDTWKSVIDTVLEGKRIGRAVAYLNERYSSIAAELSEALVDEQNNGIVIERNRRAYLWTQNEDARSWICLGDPAARLSMV
jgi:hypothetical protein